MTTRVKCVFKVPESPSEPVTETLEILPKAEVSTTIKDVGKVHLQITGRKIIFRVPRRLSQTEIESLEVSSEKIIMPEIKQEEIKEESEIKLQSEDERPTDKFDESVEVERSKETDDYLPL